MFNILLMFNTLFIVVSNIISEGYLAIRLLLSSNNGSWHAIRNSKSTWGFIDTINKISVPVTILLLLDFLFIVASIIISGIIFANI